MAFYSTALFLSHEVAESCGLLSYAFGTDGIDRYIRIYRKDNPPCEDELAARKRGEPWNEEVKRHLLERVKRFMFANLQFNSKLIFIETTRKRTGNTRHQKENGKICTKF